MRLLLGTVLIFVMAIGSVRSLYQPIPRLPYPLLLEQVMFKYNADGLEAEQDMEGAVAFLHQHYASSRPGEWRFGRLYPEEPDPKRFHTLAIYRMKHAQRRLWNVPGTNIFFDFIRAREWSGPGPAPGDTIAAVWKLYGNQMISRGLIAPPGTNVLRAARDNLDEFALRWQPRSNGEFNLELARVPSGPLSSNVPNS
ncbi:hypothetical protein BCV70DRAFT_214696 [Testicularia cyperi]|uniref:Uncharacterized protein n=1 Tax=Testicularia cyperi TaxID=1882483 RepID=A0A317XY62_9BASI|nr:hypothetical protein BCV70DRAFT_214696 [Testicularia cyperi]